MPRPKRGEGGSAKVDYSAIKNILVPYRRVSTREQVNSGAGLAAQRTSIELGLKMRGQQAHSWDCVDEGKSGKNLRRPQLEQALDIVRRGEAGGLIVSKLDRLSRSLLDFAQLMEMADREGWNLVALDLNVDLRSPGGKMMAGVLALFAQFERDVISQRTLDGLAEKRADGVRLGRKRSISDDLLSAIIGMYHETGNYSATARWLNEAGSPTPQGGKLWYPATVHKIVASQDGQAFLASLEQEAA